MPAELGHALDPGIRCVGRVPDVHEVYAAASAVIAPVRYGAGVKLKVIEAVQHGVPVVTTSVGAEGVRLTVRDAVRVADRPARFAAAVVELLTEPATWQRHRTGALAQAQAWRARYADGRWASVVARALLARRPAAVAARLRTRSVVVS
jgi:glycosyltransferase involved in cell wall biosynthesis